MTYSDNKKLRFFYDVFLPVYSKSVLRIDNTIFFLSSNNFEIRKKIEKINKSIKRKNEKGLLDRSVNELSVDIKEVSGNNIKDLIKKIIEDPEKYRGRVFFDGDPLFKKSVDSEEYNLNSIIIDNISLLLRDNVYIKNAIENISSLSLNFDDIGRIGDLWDVIGVIKQMDSTFTVYSLKDKELPSQYYDLTHERSCSCDHCGINRERKQTFILKNKEDGTEKIVGGSCLSDFVSEKTLNESLKFYEAMFQPFSGGGKIYPEFKKLEYLATAAAFIRVSGYRGSNTENGYTTNQLVKFRLSPDLANKEIQRIRHDMTLAKFPQSQIKEEIYELIDSYQSIEVFDKDYEVAKEFIEYLRSLDIGKINSGREFMYNLKNIIQSDVDYVTTKTCNLLGGGIYGYIKREEDLERKRVLKEKRDKALKERVDMGHFLGAEKTKFKSIPLQLVGFYKNTFSPNGYTEITSYAMAFLTEDGRYCMASCSSMDKLPEEFFNEEGYLMSESGILSRFKGKFIGLRGSIKDYSKKGSDDEMRMYSKFRISEFIGNFKDSSDGIKTELEGKYTLKELRIESVNDIKSYYKESECGNYYQYVLLDENGDKYIYGTGVQSETLKEGCVYLVGAHLLDRGYNDHVLMAPINEELVVEIKDFNGDNDVGKQFTRKQIEKKLSKRLTKTLKNS